MNRIIMTAGALLLTSTAAATAQVAEPDRTARAELIDTTGAVIGEVRLEETPSFGVRIEIDVRGLGPGTHAFHIHETGRCDAPSFDSAGGHYAPRGRAHGARHPHGMHAGDLLNLHVPPSGRVEAEQLAGHVTLLEGAHGTLFDDDGSAFVIHADADDYESQPAGGGGTKVACGVIVR